MGNEKPWNEIMPPVEERIYNGVKLLIAENKEAMSQIAAGIILERVRSLPRVNILVPTGTTPEGVYKILRNQSSDTFRNTNFFNMDEYVVKDGEQYGFIPEEHPASYHRYMRERLFDRINPQASYFPGIENIKNPGQYDELIRSLGGIDICLNAMGEDGHTFGFNSPPETTSRSITRLVEVTKDTQNVNQGLTGLETPDYAVTIGLKTGMGAKEMLFLVSGERKADILRQVIYSPEPTDAIPATILKAHQNCRWIIDKAAGSRL